MEVGDLVREVTRMQRKPEMGVVVAVDRDHCIPERRGCDSRMVSYPYQVRFFDGETNWMREGFLEVINESR